jgi:hypothetical protein
MDIKDDVVRLYVKRFVIPKALIFDKPAFVDFKISGKTNVFARQILVPEAFFIRLEKKLVEKYKDAGKSAMYSIGKKFGYSFSQLGRFENINDHPGDSVKDWIIIASKFVEGTYASEIKQTADVGKKTVDYMLKNFVVCRSLGKILHAVITRAAILILNITFAKVIYKQLLMYSSDDEADEQ